MQNNCYYTIEEQYYALVFENIPDWIPSDLRSCTSTTYIANKRCEYWGEKLQMKITYANPNTIIFVAQKKDIWWNVIIDNKVGWIYMKDWFIDKIRPLDYPKR